MVPCRHPDRLIASLIILLVPFVSLGLWPAEATGAPARHPVHPDILRGIELLYGAKTNSAEDLFRQVTAERPKEAAGHFYMAMVSWSRLCIGFWSREMVEQYIERIDQTISVAKEQIASGKSDAFTYFYLGGALGFKGRFYLMERKWLSSFFLALEAIEALKTCQKMDPSNRDVLLGLGIFDYYTAKMSGVLKFLTYLLLHRGDREEGLRKLHAAAEEAVCSSIEAKSVLLHIYLFMEDDPVKALPLAGELATRFPTYPRHLFLQGLAYIRLHMDSGYRDVLDGLRSAGKAELQEGRATCWNRQAYYLEAVHDLFHDRFEEARAKLDTILSMADPVSDPGMAAWPVVKKGMSYDLENQRERALEHYHRVLEMENGAGAQFLAQKYIESPARKKDPFIGY